MKGYIKLMIAVAAVLAAVLIGSNLILNSQKQGDSGRPYRVEAQRIAKKIGNGESYDLSDYPTITKVERLDSGFESGGSDYLVKEIDGTLYRFDYSYSPDSGNSVLLFNICFAAAAIALLGSMTVIYFKIIRPFGQISEYPAELAKGNLTSPLKEHSGKYFGKFLWGLDLLREKLESQRASELELQKQNKTLVLSLSHDIKTPLGAIELYAKALERGLYKTEEKKLETARSITAKSEEIRGYVDKISRTARDDFLNLEVNKGEFYLSELMNEINSFYSDKLSLLKTEFKLDSYSNCLLCGDSERAVEVLQNVIENAVKYGDGRRIAISFEREENCLLIHIENSGEALSENELPHIFESFWRGSNTGSNSGSGLGLYICCQLMRKMDGEIYAEAGDNIMIFTTVFTLA